MVIISIERQNIKGQLVRLVKVKVINESHIYGSQHSRLDNLSHGDCHLELAVNNIFPESSRSLSHLSSFDLEEYMRNTLDRGHGQLYIR